MTHERSANPGISIDSHVMAGQPCIGGTGVTVERVLRELGQGWTLAEVIEAHPHITAADVQAAGDYRRNLFVTIDDQGRRERPLP